MISEYDAAGLISFREIILPEYPILSHSDLDILLSKTPTDLSQTEHAVLYLAGELGSRVSGKKKPGQIFMQLHTSVVMSKLKLQLQKETSKVGIIAQLLVVLHCVHAGASNTFQFDDIKRNLARYDPYRNRPDALDLWFSWIYICW